MPIYLDRTFNCAHFIQSKDRIHRVGLKPDAKVNYYIMQGTDTVDEVVDARLAVKQQRMLELLEADFSNVDFDSGEDVVSEDADEEVDFKETLKQIAANVRYDHQPNETNRVLLALRRLTKRRKRVPRVILTDFLNGAVILAQNPEFDPVFEFLARLGIISLHKAGVSIAPFGVELLAEKRW